MKALKIKSKAPDFKLTDKDGNAVSLKDVAGEYTVIYFYPKDDTPGCTIEAKEFSALLSKFKKAKVSIIGISGGTDKTKEKFCDKHDLSVLLLSDTDFKVAKSYGSYGKKKFMGREFNGIYRKTFILDKNMKIVQIYNEVSAKGHAKEVLSYINP